MVSYTYEYAEIRLWRSNHEAVDDVWAKIACSVVSGPLKEVGVTMAKVETGVDGVSR